VGETAAQNMAGNPRLTHLCKLRTRDDLVFDEALAVYFRAPNSFSGEDVVEFFIHSSPYILRTLFGELKKYGVRTALPGEFSFRAVRNGKMTLSQASAVADLIGAETRTAAELALEKLSGSQNRLVESLGTKLRELAVLSEVGIDFSDQDVDEVSLPNLKRRLRSVQEALTKLRESFVRGGRIQEGVSVALLGLPNAGKSSVFNALLGEDRSIVSDIPGTTRDIVREKVTLESEGFSVVFRVSDTAGVRDTQDAVEKLGVQLSLRAAKQADLILWVVDGHRDEPQAIRDMENQWLALDEPKARSLGVITKCDLAEPNEAVLDFFAKRMPVQTCSAITGDGIHELARAMVKSASHWVARDTGEVVLTREEDLRCVEEAIGHVERALDAHEEDLFAADLNQALRSLSGLMGSTLPDDILGAIFAGFCIGK
jgi:tRNA modification GTPase